MTGSTATVSSYSVQDRNKQLTESVLLNVIVLLECVVFAFCRYVKFYGLPEPVDDVHIFLTYVAKQRNLVQRLRSPAC